MWNSAIVLFLSTDIIEIKAVPLVTDMSFTMEKN